MNLTYEQRVELLELVKKELEVHWSKVIEIDAKFKCDDPSMRNDKELYWIKEQSKAWARKELLSEVRDKLIMSL